MKKLNIKKISSFLLVTSLLCVTACKTSTRYSRSTGQAWDDKTIAHNVRKNLRHENALDKTDIKVKSYKGNVTLYGYVDHAYQRNIASEVTRNTEGVDYFQNNIESKDAMPLARKSPPSASEAAGAAPRPAPPAGAPGQWQKAESEIQLGQSAPAQSGTWQSGGSQQYITTEPSGAQPAKKAPAAAPAPAPEKQ